MFNIEELYEEIKDQELGIIKKESNSTKLKQFILSKFDFRPNAIIELLKLKNPIYQPTSIYGHFSNPNYNWEQIISL